MPRSSGGGKASNVALCGVLSALSLVFLFLSVLTPTGRIGLVAVAGLFPVAAVVSAGLPAGFFCWGASSLLALLLLPTKANAILFLLFFGLYPVAKSIIERLHRLPLEWLCKLVFFNAVFSLCWFLLRELLLLSVPDALASQWLLYPLGNVVFVLYDFGMSKLIGFYIARVDRVLRKR